MKKLNKFALALGTVATVAAPVAAVVSCGSSKTTKKAKVTPITTPNAAKPGDDGKAKDTATGDANLKAAVEQAKADAGYDKMSNEDKKTFDAEIKGKSLAEVKKVSSPQIKLADAKEISLADQYANEYVVYKASYDSYMANLKKLTDAIKDINDKKDNPKTDSMGVFYKTLLGGDSALLTKALDDKTLVPTEKLVDQIKDTKAIDADSIVALKQSEFDIRTSFQKIVQPFLFNIGTYLKTLTGDKITDALNKLIDSVDLSSEFTKLKDFVLGLLPDEGTFALVKTGVTMLADKISTSIKSTDKTELKNKFHTIVNVIDFDKIIDKVIYYNTPGNGGFILPLMSNADGSSNLMSSLKQISNLEGLLIGNVISSNKKDYTGTPVHATGGMGIEQYFGLALKDASNKYFHSGFSDQFAEQLKKLEIEFPAMTELSAATRPFTDTISTLLFGGLKGATGAGIDELDLNLKDAGIKDFVGLINDELAKVIDSFDVSNFLNKSTAGIAYDFIQDNKDKGGIIGSLLGPVAKWVGTDEEKGTAKLTELFKNLSSLVTKLIDRIKEISNNIANGNNAEGYTAATTTKELYVDLRKALEDVLSINFKTLDADASKSIKEIFPDFIEGTVLQNLLSVITKKMSTMPAAVEYVTKNFPGADLSVAVDDMTVSAVVTTIGHLESEIRSTYPTFTQNQISWITAHQTNWDLATQTAVGKEYKDKDGKVIEDADMLSEHGDSIVVPEGAIPFDAVFPEPKLDDNFEGRDGWVKNLFPTIAPSQYAALRKAMLAGKIDFTTKKPVDPATSKLIDAALKPQDEADILKNPAFFKSQVDDIRKAQTAHQWNYLQQAIISGSVGSDKKPVTIPEETAQEVKDRFKDQIAGVLKDRYELVDNTKNFEDVLVAEIMKAIKNGKFDFVNGVFTPEFSLDGSIVPQVPDDAAVKKAYPTAIADLDKIYEAKDTSKTNEAAEIQEIEDAIKNSQWDYQANDFKKYYKVVDLQYKAPDKATLESDYKDEIAAAEKKYELTPAGKTATLSLHNAIVQEITNVYHGKGRITKGYPFMSFKLTLIQFPAPDKATVEKDYKAGIDKALLKYVLTPAGETATLTLHDAIVQEMINKIHAKGQDNFDQNYPFIGGFTLTLIETVEQKVKADLTAFLAVPANKAAATGTEVAKVIAAEAKDHTVKDSATLTVYEKAYTDAMAKDAKTPAPKTPAPKTPAPKTPAPKTAAPKTAASKTVVEQINDILEKNESGSSVKMMAKTEFYFKADQDGAGYLQAGSHITEQELRNAGYTSAADNFANLASNTKIKVDVQGTGKEVIFTDATGTYVFKTVADFIANYNLDPSRTSKIPTTLG